MNFYLTIRRTILTFARRLNDPIWDRKSESRNVRKNWDCSKLLNNKGSLYRISFFSVSSWLDDDDISADQSYTVSPMNTYPICNSQRINRHVVNHPQCSHILVIPILRWRKALYAETESPWNNSNNAARYDALIKILKDSKNVEMMFAVTKMQALLTK